VANEIDRKSDPKILGQDVSVEEVHVQKKREPKTIVGPRFR
jgi:hypothetical protein